MFVGLHVVSARPEAPSERGGVKSPTGCGILPSDGFGSRCCVTTTNYAGSFVCLGLLPAQNPALEARVAELNPARNEHDEGCEDVEDGDDEDADADMRTNTASATSSCPISSRKETSACCGR